MSDKNDEQKDSENDEEEKIVELSKSEILKSEVEDEGVDDPLSSNLETGNSDDDSKPEIEPDQPELESDHQEMEDETISEAVKVEVKADEKVEKSSIVEIEEKEMSENENDNSTTDPLQTGEKSPEKSPEKPSDKSTEQNPELIDLSDEEEVEGEEEEEEEDEDETGYPDRPPGEDATREIDPEHLLPFHHGWKREVVTRKGNAKVRYSFGSLLQTLNYFLFPSPPWGSSKSHRELVGMRQGCTFIMVLCSSF